MLSKTSSTPTESPPTDFEFAVHEAESAARRTRARPHRRAEVGVTPAAPATTLSLADDDCGFHGVAEVHPIVSYANDQVKWSSTLDDGGDGGYHVNMETVEKTEGVFAGLTEAQWRERSRQSYASASSSRERTDVGDGFLTQWAGDVMGARYSRCAEIAHDDGNVEVTAIFDLDGELIPARGVDTRYGFSYVDADGNWYSPPRAKSPEVRARNNAKKGFIVGTALFRAHLNRSSDEVYVRTDRVEDFVRVVDLER